MPKFYIFSDCHGYYNELRKALDEAGFDPNDKNSWLISLGDELDRGPDPEKVINYLMGFPRAIFIKGNHTTLMEELLERGYPLRHDWSNGTAQSVMDLAPNAKTTEEVFATAYMKTKPFFDKEIDYFETEHYVFCHGYIPYNEHKDWRSATPSQWEDARWVNGMEIAMDGHTIDKCVICGHYHTSWGHALQDKTFDEWGEEADFSPFYYKDKLIAIDACTAYSGKVNVLVLEDEFI